MQQTDPRVTSYIEKAAPFAQPILTHLRKLIHQACPEITETIKWGFPNFENNGMVCHMTAHKSHCSFGFWKTSLLHDPHQLLEPIKQSDIKNLGKIKSLEDLPSDEHLVQYLQEAVQLNIDNVKAPARAKASPQELEVPLYFQEALAKNDKAQSTFEKFSYSQRKDYVSWITEAKTEATREKRIATALEWLAEGKTRNWKYEKGKVNK